MDATEFCGLAGTGVLAIWSDAAPEHDEEFNNWYTNQHLPERVGVPGFCRGRRYIRDGPGKFKYFTLYETADIGVLESGPYLERLNDPTAWTRRVLPYFRNGSRLAMVVSHSTGAGIGGMAATITFEPGESRAEGLRRSIESVGDELREQYSDITGWHLCETDDQVTRAKAATEEARASRTTVAPAPVIPGRSNRWMVMVEATRRDALDAAGELLAGGSSLTAQGATEVGEFIVYRLMIALPSSATSPASAPDSADHG